jgi:hypothetical protein
MSGQLLLATLLREAAQRTEERLARYRPDLARATGLLPNRQLAPLNLSTGDLFFNQLALGKGGTGADLEGSSAGVLQILNDGDPAVTVALLDSALIDWNNFPGSPVIGEILKFTGSGAGADFGPLDFATAASYTGTLPAANGGTGRNTYAVGDLLYASAATTLSRLADVATGNALISGGVATAPAWGKIGLTTHISGILAGTNGGTGVNNGSNLLTVPATGTAALLGTAQAFSETNSFAKLLRAHVTSGTTGYGIRIWDGTNDWGNLQAMDLGGNSYLFFSLNRYYDGSNWQQFNTRVGSSFQVTNNRFDFYVFPVSSSTPTSVFQVSSAGDITHSGFIQGVEITAPAAGAANSWRMYGEDNGAGKTRVMIKFATGAAQQIAIQP